jgi:hypothetical protein
VRFARCGCRWAVAVLLIAACGPHRTKPIAAVGFGDRVQVRSEAGLEVSAAALTPAESRDAFGVDLASKGIQPVWLQVVNRDDEPFWLMPISIDPLYFSPLESAWQGHSLLGGSRNEEIDRLFSERQMASYVAPGKTESGFVFTNVEEGQKPIEVLLLGDREVRSFFFALQVPGLKTDYEAVDLADLEVSADAVTHDPPAFRRALEALPCCTSDRSGTRSGDPLNLVMVGSAEELYAALLRGGWRETELIHGGSLWRTVSSFLFSSPYLHSPVSPLYLFGRPQDVAFQQARGSIHQRNHLRLWLAPFRLEGRPVWVGQISRDIGVRFTPRTWNLTTHAIDPDIDEARFYLWQGLLTSQRLEALGYVSGAGAASREAPRETLTGDPYFTDGYRLVVFLSEDPVALDEVEDLGWDTPPNR